MAKHVVFVRTFDTNSINISFDPNVKKMLPPTANRPFESRLFSTVSRVIIDAVERPVLPGHDVTLTQFQEWRSSLMGVVREDAVDSTISSLEMDGLCVELQLKVMPLQPNGAILEATATNIGPDTIGDIAVHCSSRWDIPRGFPPEIGQSFGFVRVGPKRLFAPGDRMEFLLGGPTLKAFLSCTASLSPDQYGFAVIAASTKHPAMHEIYRLGGQEIGDTIIELERWIDT